MGFADEAVVEVDVVEEDVLSVLVVEDEVSDPADLESDFSGPDFSELPDLSELLALFSASRAFLRASDG